jgi:choline dehydrogenase
VTTVDYVVVGAGSAGCVLASRLSADPACTVALLEAGGEDDSPHVARPADWPLLWDRAENWGYVTALQSGLGLRAITYPRGKVLGGSSSINLMIYVRGDPKDFDTWRDLGNPGWGWDDVLPYFRKLENYPDGSSELHGRGGPQYVSSQDSPHARSRAFIEAATQCGHVPIADFNGHSRLGVGLWHLTTRDRVRHSTARAYLEPARGRPNLRVHTRAHVLRLLLSGSRADGVEYFDGNQVSRIRAQREVILAAGAIDTPKLLMLSGIGNPGELERHRIPVRHSLPGVGANLHDHAATPLVLAPRAFDKMQEWTIHADAGLFMRSSLADDDFEGDIQMLFLPLAPALAARTGGPAAMVLNVQPCRPRSRGKVSLRSSNPLDPPVIDPQYLSDRHDIALHVAGLRAAREIAAADPLSSHIAAEVSPAAAATTDSDLERVIRATAGCTWHPVGTCRMGQGPEAVVDAELRVHGMQSLRIADGSVMPQITSGNTNAPIIMVAERAADLVRHGARAALYLPTDRS